MDNRGLIQDEYNIPIIYHWKRHKANKKITFKPEDIKTRWFDFGYSMALPERDSLDAHRLSEKYWWLTSESMHRKELRRRLRLT
ncbi:GSCOCG00012994001-RA-CDS [Cotesia congregata]|nr:GSCOCG00012994001-RA-CDS [Cotesia congregata]